MDRNDDADPMPYIRRMFVTTFLAGNVPGVVYLFVTGSLLDSLLLNPIPMLGTFMSLGVVGVMAGTIGGLSLRLLLKSVKSNAGWWGPMAAAAVVAAVSGWMIAYIVVASLSMVGE